MGAKTRIAAALAVVAIAVLALGSLTAQTEAHPGHVPKKLFEGRWHYEVQNGDYDSWMNLTTSDVWNNCSTQAICAVRWDATFANSISDWNGFPTSVDFVYQDGVWDDYFDVNVVIEDNLGDPGLLGLGPSFDHDGNFCVDACDVWYGVIWISNDSHSGPYGSSSARKGTLTHELGHILQLRHESVNADESLLYECGFDDTGVIPHSVMAYDCIDPVSVGGEGESGVTAFDICGVNHASYDPNIGYAGCVMFETTPPTAEPTATVTPTSAPSTSASQSPPPAPTSVGASTPTPSTTSETGQRVWGDVNCSGQANPVDSLALLRHDSGVTLVQPAGCPNPATEVGIEGQSVAWGDVDCGGDVSPVDSLKVLRVDAGLTINQPAGCPEIGDTVSIAG